MTVVPRHRGAYKDRDSDTRELLGDLGLSPSGTWTPAIEQRRHPFGEQGVLSSLEEVAKRASQRLAQIMGHGEKITRVRTWVGKKLHEAKKRGHKINTDRARAEILLGVLQNEKTWVPDPVGIEHVVGAHLMACDEDSDNPEGVCVQIGDCDDKTVLLCACFLSIGLHTAIVGHAYDKGKHIQHVIGAVKIDGEWLYADPSYDYPLGKCHPFTRERVTTIPNMQVICDAASCLQELSGFDPEQPYVDQGGGLFVGVDGAPYERAPEPVIDLYGHMALSAAPKQVNDDVLGWLGSLGIEQDGERTRAEVRTGFSNLEKIMLAGVVVSASGLVWQIYRSA